jgi:hypothetical protein
MIRILLHGVEFFLSLIIFIACSPIKDLQKSERILLEWNKYYLNDSLRFSYAFPGDYQVFHERKVIKKSLRNNNLYLNPKYCLAYFQTNIAPLLEQYLFYYKDEATADKALSKLEIYGLENGAPFVDSLKYLVLKKILLANERGVIHLIGKSAGDAFHNLLSEYLETIFPSVKTGDDYRNVDITDAFTLAEKYAWDEDSLINYLHPVRKLHQQEMNYKENMQMYNIYLQALATYHSRITNLELELDKIIQEWRTTNNYLDAKLIDRNYCIIMDEKVLDFLINKCKDERIVMFNENHFSPNSRLLVMLLLQDLHDAGYRHLALEMLWDKNINERGFTISKSGFYTREPMASNLIREAKKIGFNIFGYDDFSKDREKKQAENIYNNTFKVDSLTKVVVLAGFGHIHEKIATNRNRMAGEFKNTYHIDPLTIDQTEYKTNSNIKLAIIDTVITPKRKNLQADIYVVNNLNYDTFAQWNHYINYNVSIPDTIVHRINKVANPIDYVMNIYRKIDYEIDNTTVPVYNYMLKKPVINQINLPLPAGNYLFFIKNDYNELILSGNMDIKE